MGNSPSSPAGGGALTTPLELQQAMLAGLADPSVKARLSTLSSDPHLTHLAWDGPPLDPARPEVAALTRIALVADPGLAGRYAAEVDSKARTPAAFWSSYAAAVRGVLLDAARAPSAQPRTPQAAPRPPPADVTPAPSAAADTSTSPAGGRGGGASGDPRSPPAGSGGQGNDSSAGTGASGDDGDDDDDGIDSLLFSHDECFVYRVPPRPGAAGWAAAAWGLDKPALEGTHVRVTAARGDVTVAVWQRPSGGGGGASSSSSAAAAATPQRVTVATAPAAAGHRLVAACVIPASVRKRRAAAAQPAAASAPSSVSSASAPAPLPPDGEHLAAFLEPVLDSSRYFVARLVRGGGGGGGQQQQQGLLGLGFRDREAASALRLAILDHLAFARRQAGLPAGGAGGLPGALAAGPTGEGDQLAGAPDPHATAALEAALAGVSLAPSGDGGGKISISVGVFGRAKGGGGGGRAAGGGGSPAVGGGGSGSGRLLLPPPRKTEPAATGAAGATGAAEAPAPHAGAPTDGDGDDWGDFSG